MEAVKAFNIELSSLYEVRPPISKGKMAQVTKMAIKAIKFYKHVVQSVEKFIQKCRPEYKVPGLYVIDSIVRQSRHQFGAERDVFVPRFTKNIVVSFQNLFKCPPDEKVGVGEGVCSVVYESKDKILVVSNQSAASATHLCGTCNTSVGNRRYQKDTPFPPYVIHDKRDYQALRLCNRCVILPLIPAKC